MSIKKVLLLFLNIFKKLLLSYSSLLYIRILYHFRALFPVFLSSYELYVFKPYKSLQSILLRLLH